MADHSTPTEGLAPPEGGNGDGEAVSVTREDPRFTIGLVFDVAKVIERHGYDGVLCGTGIVELQYHLFAFLHGTDEGRDSRCHGKSLAQVCQRQARHR